MISVAWKSFVLFIAFPFITIVIAGISNILFSQVFSLFNLPQESIKSSLVLWVLVPSLLVGIVAGMPVCLRMMRSGGCPVKHVLIYLIPPSLYLLGVFIYEALEVYSTGICPGHAPDISPRPCSVSEYLIHDMITPFGVMGCIMVFFIWGTILSPIYWGTVIAWNQWMKSNRLFAVCLSGIGFFLTCSAASMLFSTYY